MKMNKDWMMFLGALLAPWILVGCGQSNPPVGPTNSSILTINIPAVNNVHSQLFQGAAQNTLLYCISGSGKPVTGSFGPLPAAAVANSMAFSVTLQGSLSTYKLVALQINDTSTGLPLAFGAAPFTSTSISIELGPMESACYSTSFYYGQLFSFENPSGVGTDDVLCNYTPDGTSGYELDNINQNAKTVAYLGNGNLVDFASVPPSSRFQVSSSVSKGIVLGNPLPAMPVTIGAGPSLGPTPVAIEDYPLAAGDVYCIQMAGGGYAWLQVTNPGSIGGVGPSFVFRLNTTVPYCAYEQSQGDLNGVCSPAG